jgi:hypothetical protein
VRIYLTQVTYCGGQQSLTVINGVEHQCCVGYGTDTLTILLTEVVALVDGFNSGSVCHVAGVLLVR